MLRDAHAVKEGRRPGLCIGPSSLDDLLGLESGECGDLLRRIIHYRSCPRLKTVGPFGDKVFVGQSFVDDDLRHPVQQSHIAAGFELQKRVGHPSGGRQAGIGHNDVGALVFGCPDPVKGRRMIFSQIGADDENTIRNGQIRKRVGHRTAAERTCQTHHGR